MRLCKIVKTLGHFPSDETTSKLLYLALAQHQKGLEDATYHLAASRQPVRDPVRQPIHLRHQLRFFNQPQYTKFLTPPILHIQYTLRT